MVVCEKVVDILSWLSDEEGVKESAYTAIMECLEGKKSTAVLQSDDFVTPLP